MIVILVIMGICLIGTLIKYYDIKSKLEIEQKPSYSVTIQATVQNNKIVYIVQDDYETDKYGELSWQSKCKHRFGAVYQVTFDTFTSVYEAENYIISILKNNIVTVNKKIDIETIQLQ